MTDETTNGAPAGAQPADGQQSQPPAVRMNILAQYIRDLSFENIVAQKGLGGEVAPEMQVQVSLDARKRQADHQYEVICKYRINSVNTNDKSTMFLCELDYAGVFQIEGVPEDQLHPFLMIECPRMLFPFVRRVLSDVVRDGGFPPFNMDPIDFVALYRQELARRAQQAQGGRPEGQPLS